MAYVPVRSLNTHQRATTTLLIGCCFVAACQRPNGPKNSTATPLEERASSIIVMGSLRSKLGTAIAGAPIRVESRPIGCSLPADSWQVAVTATDGSFSMQAYGRINAPGTGCIVARDTLSPTSPELQSDSVKFKLSAPYDTVKLHMVRN